MQDSLTSTARRTVPLLAVICLALFTGSPSAAPGPRPDLTMQARVRAQRAIEEVYWRHRIWPTENRGAKPPLDAVLSEAQLRAKVEDYLRESNAAEVIWGQPITAAQLQAEMERMAKQTRAPEVLREIFAALGDDPRLIAETLVRQTLADRLVRDWYARDVRFHGDVRRRAEAALVGVTDPTQLKSLGTEYSETTWRLARPDGAKDESPSATKPGVIVLEAAEWREKLAQLVEMRLQEEDGAFVVTGLLRRGQGTFTTATAWWPKTTFDQWWSDGSAFTGALTAPACGNFERVTVAAATPCVPDSYTPKPRRNATAVWTGSEMIVWGGYNAGIYAAFNDGGRYNPSTDSWVATSTDGAPAGRVYHSAVWTGSRMIVWGGAAASYFNDGGLYDPSTDTWIAPALTDGAPTARSGHATVWTGREMIIWGGVNAGGELNDGGRYDPSTDIWVATTTGGAPAARAAHTAVWTGSEMIVWGGVLDYPGFLNEGGRYNPSTDTWLPTTVTGAPTGRYWHTAVWTGSEMIIWGGNDGHFPYANDGGRYNPSTDSWAPTTTNGAPGGRYLHTAVWSGSEMIVWGGDGGGSIFSDGGRYNPSTDSWLPTATGGAPGAHYAHTAVWTGTEMIVWGGSSATGFPYDNDGGRYSPSTNIWLPVTHSWVPTTTSGAPAARSSHTAVWTGSEMIVWGGSTSSGRVNDGGRYNPSTDNWTQTTTSGAPAARSSHKAVWTGSEMIVWGGSGGSPLNDGGRYSPFTDSWAPTTTTGAPAGRAGHTAVWTGSEMIVWGGSGAAGFSNDGGRYDPSADSWVPTETSGAPVARAGHTAVWTGTEMIVWGGVNSSPLDPPPNTGGRYLPSTNTWLPTGLSFPTPPGRSGHTAVWTGSEMIIWGGQGVFTPEISPYLGDGWRYNPSTNIWVQTGVASGGSPAARSGHAAVWTGSEMIIWGGISASGLPSVSRSVNDGWRYSPSSDSWVQTATSGAPTVRIGPTAVWTSNEMIVWGGSSGGVFNSGGRYCVASCPTWYRDGDADGYGASSVLEVACVQPSGFVPMPGDCNDSNPAAHPGAAEICDGVDDNCNGPVDEGFGQTICGLGVCLRTVADCVGGTPQVCVPGAPSFDACDGLDNDCDGAADDGDADQDGFTVCVDCNDSMASIHPGATELCNRVDDDCDGLIDEDATSIDSDGDGVCDAYDNCPTVPNADQDPCACAASCGVSDLSISFDSPEGKGSGVVRWFVGQEIDVVGFNVVEIDSKGNRKQINPVIIPCEECSSGLGHAYAVIVPKHQSGRGFFVEVLRVHGTVSVYGPAQRI